MGAVRTTASGVRLGNIEVGTGAKIGAGSVVLQDVPPYSTVVGIPAKTVSNPHTEISTLDIRHALTTS